VEVPPLPNTQRRTLWVRLIEIYGQQFTRSYGENPDGSAAMTWAKGLAGVTPQQLAAGLAACLASGDPWVPTLPEFRARCLDIPPLARVRLELRPGQKPSPFTRLVWQHVDSHRLVELPAERQDYAIRDAYELAREIVMRGGALPAEPVASIEHDGTASNSPAGRWGLPEKPIDPASPRARASIAMAANMLRASIESPQWSEEERAEATGKMAAAGPDA
jgi:hypothetical protein